MSLLQAIILGLIQGLTEFIPISSTGHLILASKIMGLERALAPEQLTAFIAVIQLGTLGAVIAYFRRDILAITRGFIEGNLGRGADRAPARLGWLIIIGSLPIAVFGLAFKDVIEGRLTKNLWVIATSLIVWSLLLALAEMIGSRRKGFADLGLKETLAVGVAQVFALIPGSSRSGTTMTGALLSGLDRETAARFSFLLSIPAIAASGLLELKEALASLHGLGGANLAAATIVSAVVGYASIAFLLGYLRRRTMLLFILYRLVAGALLVALLVAGALTP
jgi:undecaprenyl-diphosphatase